MSPYGNDSRRTTSSDLLGRQVAERDRRAIAVRGRPVRADRLDPDVLSGGHLDGDVAGHDLERLADLGRDRIGDLRGVGDVVEMATAGIGKGLQQALVEVVADAEGRGRHAAGAQLGGVTGQLVRVGDPDVGKAVGQEQAAVDATLHEMTGDLFATAQPALAEVRAAARLDRPQLLERGAARLDRAAGVEAMTTSTTSS